MSNFENSYRGFCKFLRDNLEDDAFVDEMEDDLEEYDGIFSDLCNAKEEMDERRPARPVITCPWCKGSGEDGHDRCFPPNPYVCRVCDGEGKVALVPSSGYPKIENILMFDDLE